MLFLVLSVGALLLFIFLILVRFSLEEKLCYSDLRYKHVVVTGGSSGIGKSAAEEAVKLGAHVTIIGRDLNKLRSTVQEISSKAILKVQKIQYATLDVTSNYDSIEECLKQLETEIGPIFMLVNCAGMCICGQYEQMRVEDIKKMMDLNYYGTAYPTKYVLPGMKSRKEGIIVFVSTEAAFLGIYGYSAYSAAKWAVRGLAEALFMELVDTGVRLTLAFPPDTDTPGFKTEEETKPLETKLISGSGGLQSAEDVGKQIIHDALNGKLYSVFGFTGRLMSILYCGSVESPLQVLIQILSMGFLRTVMVGFILSFYKIVRDVMKDKSKQGVDQKNK